ncbi:MAG: sigma-70 family RNA polymerase sigma factor [Deltaproteobacteria bacterium]
MDDVRDAQLDELMSELAWLKRLAAALVRNDADANDLAQETWLVAAEHAPTDGRPLKPWLSRVALNLVRMRSRATKRRGVREAAVESFAERSPTPDELVSRVDAQRVVVTEVMRLAEPYRTTVLLHYFQDLSSAEIARRSGVPEGTVRRRLKTALDELRGRLYAEEHKTGRAVIAALAPLTVHQSTAGSAALGVVLVKKAIAVLVVVAGLLLVGAHFYKRRAGSDKPAAATVAGSGAGRTSGANVDVHTAHIAVTVLDEIGPVANAVVRCAPVDGGVVVGKTAGDGTVSIELAAGEWSIAASAEGHEPAATTLRVETAHDDRARIVLASGGRTVTGVVTDATGGVVAGARIDAAKLDLHTKAGRAVAVAFTDAAGHYKLAVAGGAVLVAASHPEYAAQERYIDLGASGASANFALVPGGVIEGVVRDTQTKQPVAGALVEARHDAAGSELADSNDNGVKTDGAGKFRFAGLRPGAYDLAARAGNRSSRTPVGVGLGVAEQQTSVVVLIAPAAALRGKVIAGDGAPAANVTVRASGTGDAETTSDGAGAFVFEGLAPGRWALTGTSDRFIADGRAIVPLAKTDVDGAVVRVRRGLEIAGHVEPRELCDVDIEQVGATDPFPHHDSMTTTLDGSFHFAPFAADKATISARCPNGDEGTDELVVADGSDNVIRVAPGGSIEGRVVDSAGQPVEGVMIRASVDGDVTTLENGVVSSGFKTVSSQGGAFQLHGLGAGSYRLGALASGIPMRPRKTVKLALTSGQHATGVEVVVERPTGKIRGTVTGPDGAAISDAWIAVRQTPFDQLAAVRASDDTGPSRIMARGGPSGASEPPPVLTDGHGRFEVANLLPGKYQVVAEARAGQLRGGAADVTTDADLAIQLASEGALHGTVHGSRGPTELFTVRVESPGANDPHAFPPPPPGPFYGGAFTDGTFVFPRIDPGDYAIEVTSTEGTGKATVHVATNEDASVDIALVSNGTVTGRVVDAAGKPASGIGIALLPDQPKGPLQIMLHEQPATSGPDGRFQVAGPPGTRMLAILGSTINAKHGIAVTAGNTIDVGDVTVEAPSPAPAPVPAPAPAPAP